MRKKDAQNGLVTSTLRFDIFVISDIDECSEGTNNCHAEATCKNTQGLYNCTCVNGYEGNGKHCEIRKVQRLKG